MVPKRSSRFVLLLAVATLLLVATAGTVAAQDVRTGGTVTIAAGETLHQDLTVFGGAVTIAGTLDGNLVVLGGTAEVTGTVTGTAMLVAGTVVLDGHLHGPVQAAAGTLHIGPNAVLDQGLRYDAGTFERDPAAVIHGNVVQGTSTNIETLTTRGIFAAWGFGLNLVLGVLLVAVVPAFTEGVYRYGRDEPLKSGGIGLAALFGTPVALILVAITIVGIPLALAGLLLFLLLAWTGYVYGGFLTGRWLLSHTSVRSRWWDLVLGVAILTVLGFIPLVGGLARFVLLVFGLGALVLGLIAGLRDQRARARQPPASPAGEAPPLGPTTSEAPAAAPAREMRGGGL